MCDEAFDDCLAALKCIPDWFVRRKMLEKFHDALLANDDLLLFDEDLSKDKFFANKMGILDVVLDEISLEHDTNFYKDDRDTIIHVIHDTFGLV